jgi:hypothetical protein
MPIKLWFSADATYHAPYLSEFVHHIEVTVDFFFGVEDLPALWTHVLSCSGFRGASAFNRLTYSIISPSKKKEK